MQFCRPPGPVLDTEDSLDLAIVGAGAAGLAMAIFARRDRPDLRVLLLDGASRPGAKILVSGGSRCNVTNTVVTERDFNGGNAGGVRRVLRGFPVADTIAFFGSLGVPLHEEPGGKLFPDSNRSRDVLEALLRGVAAAGAELRTAHRVLEVARTDGRFDLATSRGAISARAVVLATGGLSLPKTGSDGAGYGFARALGHSIVPTTAALAPLVLAESSLHFAKALAGVSHETELTLWIADSVSVRIRGSLLWTHFGISGPAALDLSRHWLRAALEGRSTRVTASFRPGRTFEEIDAEWMALADSRPRLQLATALAGFVPAAMADALLTALALDHGTILARLSRDARRRIVRALHEWPIAVADSRGYNYAEVTAGGVPLDEIDPSTMESRICPGLYLVGEVVDVDGRLGGFNFQWAWSSARVAARACARRSAQAGGGRAAG